MILRNKKTGKIETLDRDAYARLEELGLARKFTILDNSDPVSPLAGIVIPQEVREFMESNVKIENNPVTEPEAEDQVDVHDDEGNYKPRRRTKIN